MRLLRAGQKIETVFSRMPCAIETLLGGGTQGEVYRVNFAGRQFALKWYRPEYVRHDTRLRERLGIAIRRGAPTDKFLWPFDLTSSPETQGFGYLMPLLKPPFLGLNELMEKKADPSFHALATTALNLADGFLHVHAKGLCYRDISFGNVFFDPGDGDIRIADNDNVDINGHPGPVAGTPGFMAPEVMREEAAPSIETDLYSLSVMLFYIFMVHHPLVGKKELAIPLDPVGMRRLYASEPVFIFDPDDHSNEPVPGYHDNALVFWPIYPQFLRGMFIRAFTAGIRDPINGRVREGEWRQAMALLRDAIFYCSGCGVENFYDLAHVKATGGDCGHCWRCQQPLQLPARLRIGNTVIMLNSDTKLFPHHLNSDRRYDFSQPVAVVIPQPLSLKNLSALKWVGKTADSRLQDVPPGGSIKLASAMKIYFGKSEGEIRL